MPRQASINELRTEKARNDSETAGIVPRASNAPRCTSPGFFLDSTPIREMLADRGRSQFIVSARGERRPIRPRSRPGRFPAVSVSNLLMPKLPRSYRRSETLTPKTQNDPDLTVALL